MNVAELSPWLKRIPACFTHTFQAVHPVNYSTLSGCHGGQWPLLSQLPHHLPSFLIRPQSVDAGRITRSLWGDCLRAQPLEHINGSQWRSVNLESEKDGCQWRPKHKAKESLILILGPLKASFLLASRTLPSEPLFTPWVFLPPHSPPLMFFLPTSLPACTTHQH